MKPKMTVNNPNANEVWGKLKAMLYASGKWRDKSS
jgi:hypothetical protein